MINRNYTFDFISGILILYMILVHVLQILDIYNGQLLYFLQMLNFYMPWFFFKSGYFFRYRKNELKHSSKKLLYPFFLYSILGYVVYLYIIWHKGDTNWIHYICTPIKSLLFSGSLPGNEPLWFLLSLFCVRITFSFIFYGLSNDKLIISVIVLFLIGWLYNIVGVKKPDYLLNCTTGMAFFITGFLLCKIKIGKCAVAFLLLLYFLFYVFDFSSVEMRHNILERGVYIMWPIICLIGIVTLNGIFDLLSFSKNNPIVFIGKSSMYLLVLHWPIIQILYICFA